MFWDIVIYAGGAYFAGYLVTAGVLWWIGRHAGPLSVVAALGTAVPWPLLWLERWLNAHEDRRAAAQARPTPDA